MPLQSKSSMKGMFLLQRRFAYIGNELAKLLKERHGVSSFCGYVFTRDSLTALQKEKDLYTTLLLDEEVHDAYKDEVIDWNFLKKLEQEYGLPTLWPYIENDRIVRHGQLVREYPHNVPPYTHEEMLRIVQATAKKLLDLFEKEKPDFLSYYAIGAIGSFLAYSIAKKKGIPTLGILPARIGSKHVVTEHYSMFTDLEDNSPPSSESIRQARQLLREFRDHPRPYTDIDSLQRKSPSRTRHFIFLSPSRLVSSLVWQLTVWIRYLRLAHKSDYTNIKPFHLLLDRIKRKVRILYGYDDLYDRPHPGEKYVFFPLQLEPEMTTLLYAPWYADQLWLAKQIAKSLPVGYKLYVKEHLAMFGYRTRHFYKELKKIPNVRLIHPNITSYPLISNAELVTTITSTVGWEALKLQKPVVTFGDVFYNTLPSVRICKAIEDLPYLIKEQIEHFKYDEASLETYIAKLIETSVNVDLIDIWEKEGSNRVQERRDELIPLADLIFDKAYTSMTKID